MKKLIFVGILATIAATSCTVKMEQDVAPVSEGTNVTLKVEGNLWIGDETRTAYTAGTGVALTNTEKIGLFYFKDSKLNNDNVVASPTAAPGEYSFTMPAAAEEASEWFGIMPYSKSIACLTSNGSSAVLRLGPVQFPEANSFDPHCDYMAIKPFSVEGTEGAKTGTITAFKRLFAPLCVKVSGLPAGSKIYTATFSLSQDFDRSNALSGLYYVYLKDTFKDTYVAYAEMTSMGNAVSAEYATGLEAVSGSWPVWYMVNPITLKGGGSLTMTISTQDKTYTRTVTLPSDQTLSVNTLNQINFNIAGEGSTSVASITTDFTAQALSSTNKNMTASNGMTYSWENNIARAYNSASDDNGSGIKNAIRMYKTGGESFTFPTISGKNIIGAKIYTHPCSRSYSTADVSLTVDGTDKYNFNLAASTVSESMTYKGGVIDIALPAGKTSLAGLSVVSATNQVHLISAITFLVEDASIDPNDYYAKFLAGQDITIGGKVYNISTNPVYTLTKPYEWTNNNYLVYEKYGVVFLDYDPADGKENFYETPYNIKPENVVVIGRYKNNPPKISMTGSATIYPSKGSLALKNVSFAMNNYGINVVDGTATSSVKLYMEDCTLNVNADYALCHGDVEYSFSEIHIHNSIICSKRAFLANSSKCPAGTPLPDFAQIDVQNTVIMAPAATTAMSCMPLRSSSTTYFGTPNLNINFDHCTFYNFDVNAYGIICFGQAASVNFNHCVVSSPLAKASLIINLPAALSPTVTDSSISGNYFYSSTVNSWVESTSTNKFLTASGITVSGNTLKASDTPIASTANVTNLYIPVDPEKVTNGAGASYSTKTWKTWE